MEQTVLVFFLNKSSGSGQSYLLCSSFIIKSVSMNQDFACFKFTLPLTTQLNSSNKFSKSLH